MGDRVLPMPDSEALAISILKTANVCDQRVYAAIPPTPLFPLAVIRRVGGIPSEKRKLDNARIQIDVWAQLDQDIADPKAEARDQADAARVALMSSESDTFTDFNAQVTCVEDESGVMWLPDPDDGRGRYMNTYMFYVQSARM